jgi:hypothetical protein
VEIPSRLLKLVLLPSRPLRLVLVLKYWMNHQHVGRITKHDQFEPTLKFSEFQSNENVSCMCETDPPPILLDVSHLSHQGTMMIDLSLKSQLNLFVYINE